MFLPCVSPPAFNFEFLGHMYTLDVFGLLDPYIDVVKTIIAFILWFKFIVSKLKAIPAIIGQVPVIGGLPDSAQVTLYNLFYNK